MDTICDADRQYMCEFVDSVKQDAAGRGSISKRQLSILIQLIECLELMDCDDSEDLLEKIYVDFSFL